MTLPSDTPDHSTSLSQKYVGQSVDEQVLVDLEKTLGHPAPPTYRAFLHLVGHNDRVVPDWIGSDCTARRLRVIQDAARTLISDNPHLRRLPDDAFVMLLHQGYSLLFVRASPRQAFAPHAVREADVSSQGSSHRHIALTRRPTVLRCRRRAAERAPRRLPRSATRGSSCVRRSRLER